MLSTKQASQNIKEIYGIYEFYEFSRDEKDRGEQIPGGIDLRLYLGERTASTWLYGLVLGDKDEPMGDIVFGVRFYPGRSLYVDQVSVEEIVTDPHTDEPTIFAESLFADDEISVKIDVFMRMYERLFTTRTSRLEFLNDTLDIDHYIRRRLLETRGRMSIAGLTAETGYSECYIRKIFSSIHSCPPKTYGQFLRLQHAMELLYLHSASLDETTSLCGYYDQSHMNKDFKKFFGCTPDDFVKNSQSYSK